MCGRFYVETEERELSGSKREYFLGRVPFDVAAEKSSARSFFNKSMI